MAQFTARDLHDALDWIHTNEHHESGLEYTEDGLRCVAVWYRNHFDKMRIRIDSEFSNRFHKLIGPNRRPFDTRMYALTTQGKRVLTNGRLLRGMLPYDRKVFP